MLCESLLPLVDYFNFGMDVCWDECQSEWKTIGIGIDKGGSGCPPWCKLGWFMTGVGICWGEY